MQKNSSPWLSQLAWVGVILFFGRVLLMLRVHGLTRVPMRKIETATMTSNAMAYETWPSAVVCR